MSEMISEIVDVTEVSGSLYLLVVAYEEGDGGNGVGHIARTDGSRATTFEGVLSTNDTLRAMWVSPTGALWLTSEDGNVWTTAKVQWTKPQDPDAGFESYDPSLQWTVTTLPDPQGGSYPPNLGAIWGTDDSNVLTAASGGYIYHWNGTIWRQVHTAAGIIRQFSGTNAQNIFAVGENSTLLHFDGTTWQALRNPGDTTGYDLFTGACHATDGSVYICSQAGRLLHGSVSGLTVIAHNDDIQLRGLAFLGDRLLFASGAEGVSELQGSSIAVIRSTFHAVSVMAGKERLFFLDASTDTCFIEWDPANTSMPWGRISF